jgi:hypothetical protein
MPGLGTALVVIGIFMLLAGGFFTYYHSRDLGTTLLVVGMVVVALGGWLRSVAKRNCWRIEPVADGAVFTSGDGRRIEVQFAELAAVSHLAEPWYENGIYTGVRHRLRLWRKEDPPKRPLLAIDCRIAAKKNKGEAEGMQALGNAVVAAVAERLESVIGNGGVVQSPGGLQFDGKNLRYQGKSVPVEGIGELGFHDGKFCVWEKGSEYATLKFAPAAANMLPIMELVRRRVAQRPPEESDKAAEGLGRLLFERRQSKVGGLLLMILSIPLCLVGVGVLLFKYGKAMMGGYFRCHERGVSQRDWRGEKRLLYTDVASFTYGATRMYVNGAYVGTTLSMKFLTEEPDELPPITYSTTVKNADDDLDALRDRIAAVVAQRLLTQYAETGVFQWGPALTVTRTGIRYRKGGFFGKKDPEVLLFENYGTVGIAEGSFQLYAKDNKKPLFSCSISQPNFFPGLFAFLQLVDPGAEPSAEPRSPA